MDLGLALALWLHALGLVIAVGYYGVLGRIIIPSLERTLNGGELVNDEAALHGAVRRVRLAAEAATGLGAIAILLTALAQASQ